MSRKKRGKKRGLARGREIMLDKVHSLFYMVLIKCVTTYGK